MGYGTESRAVKALTIRQPWATLIALGVKTIETRSWRAPQALIGQTIAIHAGKHEPALPLDLGAWSVFYSPDRECYIMREFASYPDEGRCVDLPLGAIVATATLADCVPMVASSPDLPPYPTGRVLEVSPYGSLWLGLARPGQWSLSEINEDLTDQSPYGDFRPGRWAWLLTDVKPTTECCSNDCARFDGNVPGWTRGSSWDWVPCGVCGGAMKCPPIPAKGKQGVWTWQP